MTFATTDTSHGARATRRRPSILSRIGAYLVAYAEASSRHDRVARLEALSDADLARIGITREGIVAHVFADKLYL